MRQAEQHFVNLGYDIQDVSCSKPFDLLCTKGDAELHVEVKGTTGAGEAIFLTFNEVEHACANSDRMALFILHSIELRSSSEIAETFTER